MNREYDVAVVGGGPAGSATALRLAAAGCSVLLLERSSYEGLRIGETLDPTVAPLLHELGAWDAFLTVPRQPSHAVVSSWGSESFHTSSHLFNPHGSGWYVDRGRFDRMLFDSAVAAGAEGHQGTGAASLTREGAGGWRVSWARNGDARTAAAAFVVNATGRVSGLTRYLANDRRITDRLVGAAVRYRWKASRDRRPQTTVESARDGWWYAAPVPDNDLIVTYLTTSDLAAGISRWDVLHRHMSETRRIREVVGHARLVSRPRVFAAWSQCLVGLRNPDLLPVGDALLAMDPLSGQGVYGALMRAIEVADVVQRYLGGQQTTVAAYLERLNCDFAGYLDVQKGEYLREQRWATAPFWAQMHAGARNGPNGSEEVRPGWVPVTYERSSGVPRAPTR